MLVIVMLFGPMSVLRAEETGFNFMADDYSTDYQDYTNSERAKMIALNFLFGAGSYTNGHTWDGVLLTSLEAAGIFLVALPSIAGWEAGLSEKGKEAASNPSSLSGASSNNYYDDRLSPETNYSIWCYVGGGALLIADIVFNITKPLQYHKPRPLTARLDDPRNWTAALYPAPDGTLAGRITFTARL